MELPAGVVLATSGEVATSSCVLAGRSASSGGGSCGTSASPASLLFSVIAALTHLLFDQLAATLGFSAANLSKSITPQVAGLEGSSSSAFFGKGREMSSKGGKAFGLARSAAVADSAALAALGSCSACSLVCRSLLGFGLSLGLPLATLICASVGVFCCSSSTEAGKLSGRGAAGRNKVGSSAGAARGAFARVAFASGAASALFFGGNRVGRDTCVGTAASASAGLDCTG